MKLVVVSGDHKEIFKSLGPLRAIWVKGMNDDILVVQKCILKCGSSDWETIAEFNGSNTYYRMLDDDDAPRL